MGKWVPRLDNRGAYPFLHIKFDSEVNTPRFVIQFQNRVMIQLKPTLFFIYFRINKYVWFCITGLTLLWLLTGQNYQRAAAQLLKGIMPILLI